VPELVVLVRHASTAWSKSRQHTGRTDLPLDADGEAAATALGPVLRDLDVTRVYSSPLRRALDTCRLAGLGEDVAIDDRLCEWDYGEYEGRTTAEIHEERPGWELFGDGCPGGEGAEDVGARIDAFLKDLTGSGDRSVMCFAHGHVLRVFGARWIGLPPQAGRHFVLDAPSVTLLSWEHGAPAIVEWNH
jgi:probable phosphoglycerate mutase